VFSWAATVEALFCMHVYILPMQPAPASASPESQLLLEVNCFSSWRQMRFFGQKPSCCAQRTAGDTACFPAVLCFVQGARLLVALTAMQM
jgi:hypothetical protein